MSYQRADATHFYIWMGSEGLNLSHHSLSSGMISFKHGDPASRENATALLDGLIDFMEGEGMTRDLDRLKARIKRPVSKSS